MGSSDDSTTAKYHQMCRKQHKSVIKNKQNLSLIGIKGIEEYTSWYIDGKFVSQQDPEVPSISPRGK